LSRRRNSSRRPAGSLFKSRFAQPPQGLYAKTSIYHCGKEMELENFKAVLEYKPGLLRVYLGRGVVTITGDQLQIVAMEKNRLWLRGIVLRTEFSYE